MQHIRFTNFFEILWPSVQGKNSLGMYFPEIKRFKLLVFIVFKDFPSEVFRNSDI